jgi:hypothetical protein
MPRIAILVVGSALWPLLAAHCSEAAEAQQRRAFKFTLISQLDTQVAGQQQKVDADTDVQYTWTRDGDKRILSFDSMRTKVKMDGQETMAVFMSGEKFATREQGKTKVVPIEQTPPQMKTVLQDSYGVPICILHVDQNGREVKREVVARPGAKNMVDQGMIVNVMLFHPPYMPADREWLAPAEVSMGNGGVAKGELNYKRAEVGGGNVVTVSGTLSNDRYQQPNSPVTMKDAKYVIAGEQTYEPAIKDWVATKLTMDISFTIEAPGEPPGQAKGTIVATMNEVVPQK